MKQGETQMGWSLLQNRSIFLRIPDTSSVGDRDPRAPLSGEAGDDGALAPRLLGARGLGGRLCAPLEIVDLSRDACVRVGMAV